MIVKNESEIIKRALQSVKPIIDYWVIVDTGSTDGTQNMIKAFLHDIPGELHERPWIDFAHNRNEALAIAKEKEDYILIIDADESLVYENDFSLPPLDKDFYYIETHLSGTKYKRVQLIKSSLNWVWKGVVHEALSCPSEKTCGVLEKVANIPKTDGARSKDPEKFAKDAKLLEAALEKEPDNLRTLFYLAQSYKDAGRLEKAIEIYEKRVLAGGWDQEVFWSLFQIALLKEILKKCPEEVIEAYKKAFHYRPTRAEPLYRLGKYCRDLGHHAESYAATKEALALKKPHDILFVEDWIYEYGLLMEFSLAAYHQSHFLESLLATKLMLAQPNLPKNYKTQGEQNLFWILKKIKNF